MTRARPALRQDIETIVRPFSGLAVARRVIADIAKSGPYAKLFQLAYFDSPSKIKTSSIVSYGLRPLVKFDGDDSLFSAWKNPDKERLKAREKKQAKGAGYEQDIELLEKYIEFCVKSVNDFLLVAKLSYGTANWDVDAEEPSPLLRPTSINGLIACLRRVILNGIGYHISKQAAYPLDYAIFSILENDKNIKLRNRIIWSFAHGLHSASRFSGRHETVLWFTKGTDYFFDLDSVRVPQKYPGKTHYKGPSKGQYSGNPLGKNPGDVWDIPNVKGNHIEKSGHPCQFPVALVQRLVRSLCPADGLVFDPFMGAGSSGVAAAVEGRRFVGAELKRRYFKIGYSRIETACGGEASYRPIEKPIHQPNPRSCLLKVPSHFKIAAE